MQCLLAATSNVSPEPAGRQPLNVLTRVACLRYPRRASQAFLTLVLAQGRPRRPGSGLLLLERGDVASAWRVGGAVTAATDPHLGGHSAAATAG
jgi:hypothetical protein